MLGTWSKTFLLVGPILVASRRVPYFETNRYGLFFRVCEEIFAYDHGSRLWYPACEYQHGSCLWMWIPSFMENHLYLNVVYPSPYFWRYLLQSIYLPIFVGKYSNKNQFKNFIRLGSSYSDTEPQKLFPWWRNFFHQLRNLGCPIDFPNKPFLGIILPGAPRFASEQ